MVLPENVKAAMLVAINRWHKEDIEWEDKYGENVKHKGDFPLRTKKLSNGFEFNSGTRSILLEAPHFERRKLLFSAKKQEITTTVGGKERNAWSVKEFLDFNK